LKKSANHLNSGSKHEIEPRSILYQPNFNFWRIRPIHPAEKHFFGWEFNDKSWGNDWVQYTITRDT